MKLLVIAVVLLISAGAFSQPVTTHYLPKEYYQRQNLPERPGYIPVYIKHDDEPLIKWDDGSNGRTREQTDEKEVLSVNQEEQEAENKSTAAPEKAQAEQKSKTKKVIENSSQKRKDSKE